MNKRMPRILILIAILNQLHGQGGGQGYGDMVIMGIPFTHTDSLLAESHDNWDFTIIMVLVKTIRTTHLH